MTIGRSMIRGGPAGDVGLGAFAQVLRWIYAVGPAPSDRLTDQQHVDLFAAFLAGQGPPAR